MSYQKDREEFVAVIVAESLARHWREGHIERFGYLTVSERVALARLILRDATIIQRITVDECNRELTPAERKRRGDAETRIDDACKPWGIMPTFNGDPRGACVKLLLPSGRWNSFGGKENGYCVPTR